MKTKTYTTPQAAEKIGVSFPTLHRWLRDKRISPQGVRLQGRTLWLWTDADIAKAREVKATLKPGPKPKSSAKRRGGR
jgi:predicted DNA-binding transcriptional regulator AlpA